MIHLQFWAYGSWDSLFPIPLLTNESKTLFLMTSLPYYCIPGLTGTRCNKNLCPKDAGCAGNKITGTNSVIPAHTAQEEARLDQGLHCLHFIPTIFTILLTLIPPLFVFVLKMSELILQLQNDTLYAFLV